MLYVRLQETLWPGFCYCLVVREQRPPLTVCLQSADNVHSLIKRCSQRGIYAVNNSQKPPLSIRRPTFRNHSGRLKSIKVSTSQFPFLIPYLLINFPDKARKNPLLRISNFFHKNIKPAIICVIVCYFSYGCYLPRKPDLLSTLLLYQSGHCNRSPEKRHRVYLCTKNRHPLISEELPDMQPHYSKSFDASSISPDHLSAAFSSSSDVPLGCPT